MANEEEQKQLAIDVHSQQAQEFAERYQTMAKDEYANPFVYSRKRLNEYLERYLPERGEGLKLLDAGCGTGNQMLEMRARGFEVSGMDGSGDMLDIARQNNPGCDIQQADVDELPYPDNSFDFILCIEVLRYLPDARGAVREMARVLKPGGVALVTALPALNLNGYYLVNRAANALPQKKLTRLKQFFNTTRSLRRIFQQAGFRAPAIHGVYLGPLNWAARLAPGRTPGLLKKWESVDSRVSDHPNLREFANMFLVRAVKKAPRGQ